MKLLLGCVNSAVSLVGYDWESATAFWYCPGNHLRVCGVHAGSDALWIASDNKLTSVGVDGVRSFALPGPHENFAHSVKQLGRDALGVADTGNSRILLFTNGLWVTDYTPLNGWETPLPLDAIHLNDMLPWEDGILASAFSYQPFQILKKQYPRWQRDGLGVLFHIRHHDGFTISRITASGLNCPHSLTEYEGDIYCCASSEGTFHRFTPDGTGQLRHVCSWHITDDHFLRGCLRVPNGWVLGGSATRHADKHLGMALFFLADSGEVECRTIAPAGEIYDILPWQPSLMRTVARQILHVPVLPLEGTFPPLCGVTF